MKEAAPDLLQRAGSAFLANDLSSAEQIVDRLLRDYPPSSEAWRLLGRIRTRQQRVADAEEAFREAGKVNPRDPELSFELASLRLHQGRFGDAIPLLGEVLRRTPGHVEARLCLARAHLRTGDANRARELIGRPASGPEHLLAAECAMSSGDVALAEPLLRAGLAESADAVTRSHLHRRLAEILERSGRCSEALNEFAAGRETAPADFDWHHFRTRYGRCLSFFTAQQLAKFPRPTIRTRRPIFIASLPRSGTTLLAKQIAAHPNGADAGETAALNAQVDSWSDPSAPSTSWPLCMRGFLARDFDAVVQGYLGGTNEFETAGVERVADKHLWNWLHVGLIAAAFPEATIVHLSRDPMDTGLSCFDRLYHTRMRWAASLDGIGEMLARAEHLMAHWHAVLPGRLIPVRYEDLVRDPRTHLGRVLDAAGLSWSDACLAHEKPRSGRVEPVPTASADQVAKPIYDSSIGRAERFGSALDPMRQAYVATKAALGG